MKKHIWWSFSVADASFLCLSSGVSSRLVPPTWEDHHPQKIGGVHWHHGNGQWGWDLGGNKFGSSSLWRVFFPLDENVWQKQRWQTGSQWPGQVLFELFHFLAPTSVFCSNACSTFSWGWHRGGGEDGKSWGTYYMTHYRWQKLYKQHWGGQHILGGMAPAPPWWHPCHFIGHFLCFDRSASLCSFVFVTLLVTVLSLFMMFLHVFLFCFHFLLFCFKIFSFFCPCIPIESLTKAFEGLKIFIGFHHISIWQKSVSFLQNFGLKRKFPAEV